MTTFAAFMLFVSFTLGVVFARRAPLEGLLVLLAIFVPTGSFPWQVGLPNVTLTFAYTLGFVPVATASGLGINVPQMSEKRGKQWIIWCSALLCIVFLTSLGLTISKRYSLQTLVSSDIRSVGAEFMTFAPDGFIGEIQAACIFVLGVGLLLLALVAVKRYGYKMIVRAFTFGIILGVISPLVQLLFLDPWVRPDRRTYEGVGVSGLVGFFQDPHSYAAFLVISVAFSFSLGVGYYRDHFCSRAFGYWILTVSSWIVLMFTNSRTGLIASLCAVVFSWLIMCRRPGNPVVMRRRRRATIALVLIGLMAVASILVVAPVRKYVHQQLVKLGNPRMWALLAEDPLEALDKRTVRRKKVGELLRTNSIWGVGPNRFRETPVVIFEANGKPVNRNTLLDHPHNYFAQIATESGVPAVIAFLALISLVLVQSTWEALSRASESDGGLKAGVSGGLLGVLIFSILAHPLLIMEIQAAFWILAAVGCSSYRCRDSNA